MNQFTTVGTICSCAASLLTLRGCVVVQRVSNQLPKNSKQTFCFMQLRYLVKAGAYQSARPFHTVAHVYYCNTDVERYALHMIGDSSGTRRSTQDLYLRKKTCYEPLFLTACFLMVECIFLDLSSHKHATCCR